MNQRSEVRIVGPTGLTPDEIIVVNQLVAKCNRAEGLDLPIEATAADATNGVAYCLAWKASRLVGVLAIQGNDEAEVFLAVDPDHRRQGVGRALLTSARDAVRDRGATSFLLVADEASRAGRAFVAATGARYHSSEYRLVLDESAVPTERDWPTVVDLRQASSTDASLVVRLIAASFGDSEDYVSEWVARALTLENHRFYIACIGEEPIGTIRTNYYGASVYITAFGIIPEWRGRGFGRQVLLRTIDRLIAEKWPRILIEVETDNRNALGLYLSCGFKELTTYGYYQLDFEP